MSVIVTFSNDHVREELVQGCRVLVEGETVKDQTAMVLQDSHQCIEQMVTYQLLKIVLNSKIRTLF